jgi:hypothetical protein
MKNGMNCSTGHVGTSHKSRSSFEITATGTEFILVFSICVSAHFCRFISHIFVVLSLLWTPDVQ